MHEIKMCTAKYSPYIHKNDESSRTLLGCDKFWESRNWDSKPTNGLRIRIPGDRKPRIKFLREISGYFRLLRYFRKKDI